MKRKLVYLPSKYSKEIVDNINSYFDKGYEIEDVYSADAGQYLLLVLKDNGNYYYKYAKDFNTLGDKNELIEDMYNFSQTWTSTNTKDKLN